MTDITGKHDYCMECAPKNASDGAINLADFLEGLQSPEEFQKLLRQTLPKNTRFPDEAFEFVQDALETIIDRAKLSHVSAKALLEALRELALARFGKGAKLTLGNWGIHRTEDFGEIVFAMVNAGLLSVRPEDKPEDFAKGYDFDEAFPAD